MNYLLDSDKCQLIIRGDSSSHYEKEGRKACTKGRGSDNVKKDTQPEEEKMFEEFRLDAMIKRIKQSFEEFLKLRWSLVNNGIFLEIENDNSSMNFLR